MDKKNTTIGVLFIVAAIASIWFGAKHSQEPATPAEVRQAVAADQAQAAAPAAATAPASAPAPAEPADQAAFSNAVPDAAGAGVTTLENSFIQARFTDSGGAILDVALKKYPAALHRPDFFVLNELHADPMLAFVNFPGLDRRTRFRRITATSNEVVYRAELNGQIEVTRRYVLAPDTVGKTDPYQIRAETIFRNLTDKTIAPMNVSMAISTAAPTSLLDRSIQLVLLDSGYSNGHDQTFVRRSQLEGGPGLFGMGASETKPFIESPGPIVWATVKNQFFNTTLTPDQPGLDLVTRRVKLLKALPDNVPNAYGVTAAAQFAVPALAPHGTATLGASFYTGPNEYHRLANTDVFKADQDRVMQFGYFRFFSEFLLVLMTWIHSFIPNWGVAIICTTLLLRSFMLMFTIPSSRSARRMQKIQPEMKALKEKFKDNPQKQQAATMELFKKHKVNPLGGCLPMLVTLPFFWGFFKMLESAAELRFAPFLWAKDLSMPDTVLTIGHGALPFFGTLNINILPILMAAVTFLQMRVTPQPTVDSAQANMMKFTPLFMVWIYYTYSCALSLYSTVNGLFMIGQQLLINRMKDDGDPTHARGAAVQTSSSGGKPQRNVTPKKK